jgi:hypothetical protein
MNGDETLNSFPDDTNLFFPQLSGDSPDAMDPASFFPCIQAPIMDENTLNSQTALQDPNQIPRLLTVNSEKGSKFGSYTPKGSGSSLAAQLQPFSIDRCSSTDPWPLEWHASREEQRVAVPSLSPTNHGVNNNGQTATNRSTLAPGSGDTTSTLDETSRKSIVEVLSLPFEHHPWQEDVKLFDSLPGPEIIDHFVDLYFLRFHEVITPLSLGSQCLLSYSFGLSSTDQLSKSKRHQ